MKKVYDAAFSEVWRKTPVGTDPENAEARATEAAFAAVRNAVLEEAVTALKKAGVLRLRKEEKDHEWYYNEGARAQALSMLDLLSSLKSTRDDLCQAGSTAVGEDGVAPEGALQAEDGGDAKDIQIDMLGGNCPVQAEGTIDGEPFYFRARGEHWSLSVGGSDVVCDPRWEHIEPYGDGPFAAGWMSEDEARQFITKGALLFRAASAQGQIEEPRSGDEVDPEHSSACLTHKPLPSPPSEDR